MKVERLRREQETINSSSEVIVQHSYGAVLLH